MIEIIERKGNFFLDETSPVVSVIYWLLFEDINDATISSWGLTPAIAANCGVDICAFTISENSKKSLKRKFKDPLDKERIDGIKTVPALVLFLAKKVMKKVGKKKFAAKVEELKEEKN